MEGHLLPQDGMTLHQVGDNVAVMSIGAGMRTESGKRLERPASPTLKPTDSGVSSPSVASGVSTNSRLSRSPSNLSIASIATSDAFDDGTSSDDDEPQLLVLGQDTDSPVDMDRDTDDEPPASALPAATAEPSTAPMPGLQLTEARLRQQDAMTDAQKEAARQYWAELWFDSARGVWYAEVPDCIQVLGHGETEDAAVEDAHFKLCYVIRHMVAEDAGGARAVPSPSARGLARSRSLLNEVNALKLQQQGVAYGRRMMSV